MFDCHGPDILMTLSLWDFFFYSLMVLNYHYENGYSFKSIWHEHSVASSFFFEGLLSYYDQSKQAVN